MNNIDRNWLSVTSEKILSSWKYTVPLLTWVKILGFINKYAVIRESGTTQLIKLQVSYSAKVYLPCQFCTGKIIILYYIKASWSCIMINCICIVESLCWSQNRCTAELKLTATYFWASCSFFQYVRVNLMPRPHPWGERFWWHKLQNLKVTNDSVKS